jgi:putative aldouronate transport system permease protein
MAQSTPRTLPMPVAQRRPSAEDRPSFRAVWRRHWTIYAMMAPAAILLLVFHIYPLWGIAIAFVNYTPYKGLGGSPWVGLQNFQQVFQSLTVWTLVRNTLTIAIGKIAAGTLVALTFALMLNEIRHTGLKRMTQTFTTLPHFLSWILIGGIMVEVLSSSGLVNRVVAIFGAKPILFLGRPAIFPWTLILSDTWKEFGWGAVIYLAALTDINPDLYEAAAVDGAGRWGRLLHITLPGIMPMIVLLACLNLGGILEAGFDQVWVLLNPIVLSTGDILDTYVYRVGLLQGRFSLAAALGVFKSTVGFVLIVLSYWLADRLANYRVF